MANDFRKSSSLVRRYGRRLVYWLKNGDAVIPVFGAGGVGKTTIGRFLCGADPLDMVAPYEESWLIEPIKLPGDVPGQLLVGPGQVQRVDRHWPELLRNVVEGKSFGIVNVVSYGYHSFAIRSYREHEAYRSGMTEGEFMDKYAQARREIEIALLWKVIQSIATTARPLWMVTLVNKQDLWWSERQAVQTYYEQGEYGTLIRDFTTETGKHHFQHEFLPVSLSLGNLETTVGEQLALTTAGYDLNLHMRYLKSMFERIHDLIAQGAP